MISSGTLILSVLKEYSDKVQEILSNMGITSSIVGKVIGEGEPTLTIHRRDGSVYSVDQLQPDRDELAEIWRRYPRI